jgi:hypothetical protein
MSGCTNSSGTLQSVNATNSIIFSGTHSITGSGLLQPTISGTSFSLVWVGLASQTIVVTYNVRIIAT